MDLEYISDLVLSVSDWHLSIRVPEALESKPKLEETCVSTEREKVCDLPRCVDHARTARCASTKDILLKQRARVEPRDLCVKDVSYHVSVSDDQNSLRPGWTPALCSKLARAKTGNE